MFYEFPSKIDQNIEVWRGRHYDWIQIYGRTLNFPHDLQGALAGELQREPRWKQKYLSSEQFHISVQKLGNIPILTWILSESAKKYSNANMNFWAPAKVQESDEGDDDDGDDAEEDDDVDDKADYEILTWICENQHKSKEVHNSHLCQTRKSSGHNYIYVFLKCKLF